MDAVIKKQNFPEFYVNNLASNKGIYQVGKDAATTPGVVGPPYANVEKREIYFDVNDGEKEEVTLSFYKNGVAKGYQCTCKAFENLSGACSHVVAAMLALNAYEAEDIPGRKDGSADKAEDEGFNAEDLNKHFNNDQAFQRLLKSYRNTRHFQIQSLTKKKVNFEFDLEIKGSERVSVFVMTMRMGVDHLYVVNDIEATLSDIMEGKTIEFGKRFTYEPAEHRIGYTDMQLLEFLFEIQSLIEATAGDVYIGDRKGLIIPPQYFKVLLERLAKVEQKMVLFEHATGEEGRGKVQHASLTLHPEGTKIPLSIKISEIGDKRYAIYAPVKEWERLRFYNGSEVCLVGDEFYFMNSEDIRALSALRQSFEMVHYDAIILDAGGFNDFASEVLPVIQRLVDIEMEDEISESIMQADLEPQIYVDWQRNILHVRPVFRYLNHSIYPLDESEEGVSNDRLLIRDVIEENELFRQFIEETSEFAVDEGYLVSDDLDVIMDFLYNGLEVLAGEYEIYMTNTAQNILYSPSASPYISIEVRENSNLLDISFELEDIDDNDLREVMKALNDNRNYYRLSDGKLLNLKDRAFQEMHSTVTKMDLDEDEFSRQMEAPLFKGMSVINDDIIKKGEAFENLVEQLFEPEELDFEVPESLNAELRNYQIAGYNWLKTLDYYGFGGVLADDMGLGKTIQTITFMLSKYEKGEGPFMIVAPSSVVYNWENEIKKFAPKLGTTVIQGNQEERLEKIAEAKEQENPIWITSYPLIQRDVELYSDITFETLILDEAQYVKNAQAKTTKAVRSMKRNNTIALSGTPIENHLGELYSLFSIVMPGLFRGPKHFKDLDTKTIADKIRPFVLRRLKVDVLQDLPEKTETTEYIELSEDQKKIYQAQLAMLRDDVEALIADDNFQRNRMSILAGMTRLRQICNDPRLVIPDYAGESSKLARLVELLVEARENGKRVVLFSQFTSMLALIRNAIDQLGFTYHYLDGSTPTEARLELATRFNMGEKDLFLVSLRAGGTGMNLTGGDTVILYDSWWNPAVEDQAADRVHRFGQKKVVQVIRLITRGTIEERINELQGEKRELIDSVIETGETSVNSLSQDEILQLLEY